MAVRSKNKLGFKHRCLHCSALFYDMGAEGEELICPNCEKIHHIEDAIKLKPFCAEDRDTLEEDDNSDDDVVEISDDEDDEDVAVIKPNQDDSEN